MAFSEGSALPGPGDPMWALYQDIVAADGLAAALRAATADRGLVLGDIVGQTSSVGIPDEGGHFSITLGVVERWFIVEGWRGGVRLAWGKTANFAEVVDAVIAWRTGATLEQLTSRCSFIGFDELSSAHERGPFDAVDTKWRLLLAEELGVTGPLVVLAYAEPRLRQLFPYTSHRALCFSRCTGYPYTNDVPAIVPCDDGRYRVTDARLDVHFVRTPEDAVALVVTNLPPDSGPARAGAADVL